MIQDKCILIENYNSKLYPMKNQVVQYNYSEETKE